MLLVVLVISFTGCEGVTNEIKKVGKSAGGEYVVYATRGCEFVTYHPDGYVNSEGDTDGYYFYVNSKLVRVSGNVIIEEK